MPEKKSTGEVDRIERAHRLDRKRLLGTRRDLVRDLQHRPACRRLCQRRRYLGRPCFDEVAQDNGSAYRAMTLDEGEA